MNENEIVKAFNERCKDCTDEVCDYTDCHIYKFFHSKREMDPELTLKKYCKSCLNGNKFEEACCSSSCAIYKIRIKKES
jgi:hypothetical protein